MDDHLREGWIFRRRRDGVGAEQAFSVRRGVGKSALVGRGDEWNPRGWPGLPEAAEPTSADSSPSPCRLFGGDESGRRLRE
jgi:hypothetical protein